MVQLKTTTQVRSQGLKKEFNLCVNLRIVISKENTLRRLSSIKMGAIRLRIPGRMKGTAHALSWLL